MDTTTTRVGTKVCLVVAAIAAACRSAQADSYTVTTSADRGSGSLRDAIVAANQRPGHDRIKFDIAGSGPHDIRLDSELPTIVDELVIDGSTQPGFEGVPLIVVDGGYAEGESGFTLAVPSCSLIGLSMIRWRKLSKGCDAIVVSGADCLIVGCYVGLRPDSKSWYGNDNGIRVQAPGCVIQDCVVSGNDGFGIWFEPTASAGAVRHNVIGPEPAGLYGFGNGLPLSIGAPDVTVGGAPADRNLIAGNHYGINVYGAEATGVVITSNWIGLDSTGAAALTNYGPGIELYFVKDCTICGNVISGNYHEGIYLLGRSTKRNVISGNIIGLDATGVLPIGNGGTGGINVSHDASQNTIGPLNVVSGHRGNGISVLQRAHDNVITGNLIGSDAAGAVWLGNGGGINIDLNAGATVVTENLIVAPLGAANNGYAAVRATGGTNHVIDANIIRSHAFGVLLERQATDCVVSRNEITDCLVNGVLVYEQVFDSFVVANTVARSGQSGIVVNGSWNGTPYGITISANSLFDNVELAIDLGPRYGPNVDDQGDGDGGPNGQQNRPVLDWALNETDGLHVGGRLNSIPLRPYRIELFGCTTADPDAEVLLATFDLTTDAAGDASFRVVVPSWTPGLPVSATATDGDGNTSEVGWVLVSAPLGNLRVPKPPPPPIEQR